MTDSRPPEHPATAWVDLDRIRDNYRAIQAYAGARAMIPVLKANAYGHGAEAVARALTPLGVAMFAVAYVDEAIALRQAGISAPLLVLTGWAPGQLREVLSFDLTPVVSTGAHLRALQELKRAEDRARLRVHVKVDTGMSRLGFSVREVETAIHRIEDIEGMHIEGLMTHLASADEDLEATAQQLDVFEEAIARVETLGVRPELIHAANSAGMLSLRETHTAVRPGLLLYGVKPRPLSPEIEVRTAMEFRVRVAQVKTIAAGTPVSYGGRFVAGAETRIATLCAGYADGIPRTDKMRDEGALRYGRTRLPVRGTVCMDLTMVDATATPDLKAGDEVTVLGDSPSAWDVADWAGTNAWQILTGVGARVPRRYGPCGEGPEPATESAAGKAVPPGDSATGIGG